MQGKTRIHRRHNRKRRSKIFLSICFLLILIVAGILIYLKTTQKVVYISPLADGFKIDISSDRDESLVLLKKLLNEKKIEYTDIKRYGRHYTIMLKDGSEVHISSKKEIIPQIASLQLILSRLTMEGKGIKALDLRFDKPVIRLK